ncbi:unnamed protein product [Fusarium graminearum]|uniref:Uncharacterized protein n=1 Tax=Gibberella zeae TaxID=5518 RepID=A0A4E9DN66_GIBZA|nr:unnamed protein product [Fusarium graminearum]CAF3491347.1 unnamed protein product [Fusarium graminearum]CAG1977144.1 unnamed protein product [Fusarium graminearum]
MPPVLAAYHFTSNTQSRTASSGDSGTTMRMGETSVQVMLGGLISLMFVRKEKVIVTMADDTQRIS